ncbi:MAG: hypothetical protein JRI71_08020 [Deltaproteobacteria bacterium]|nr:hypothetical protein [Deltaproteobacteria bacterium]
MTHMLGPGNHPHGQHYDTIGYRELGCAASDKRDALFEHSVEVKFLANCPRWTNPALPVRFFSVK